MIHQYLGAARIGRQLFLVAVLSVLPTALQADCIDYAAYLHWEGNVFTSLRVYGMATSGTNAFLASGPQGLYIVDVSDPSIPRVSARIDSLFTYRVAAEGQRLYVRATPRRRARWELSTRRESWRQWAIFCSLARTAFGCWTCTTRDTLPS